MKSDIFLSLQPSAVDCCILLLSLRVYIYIFGIYIRRSLKNIYRGFGIGGGYYGRIQRVYCAQTSPICLLVYVFSLLDQSSPNFCTKFCHNLAEVTVVFSVCFYDSYFISFAYWLCSWLPNPSK